MKAKARHQLPDHANEVDARHIPLQRVGINELKYPIQILDRSGTTQSTVAEIGAFVSLPGDQRGTHMSRLVETIHLYRSDMTIRQLPHILKVLQDRLEAPSVELCLQFPYFIEKKAPISEVPSLMDYKVGFTATLTNGRFDFRMEIRVPVKSLCPCSKGISERGAHNQRSEIKVRVRSQDFIWIEDVVAAVESQASAPLFALLKREDEKYITERAYDHPKFAEDLARDTLIALKELESVMELQVIVENQESIHNHQAYAEAYWSSTPSNQSPIIPATSASPSLGDKRTFGAWLRQFRLDRKISQSDLAKQLRVTPSYLSRVENNDRAASTDMLNRLSDIFGVSEAELHLRSGRLPPEFRQQAMLDPQSLLQRLSH